MISNVEEERKLYVSIDAEYAGPIPPRFSLLSIGACLVDDPNTKFYVEIRPLEGSTTTESAERVLGTSFLERCKNVGVSPKVAMKAFAEWLEKTVPGKPIGVFFNAPSDFLFISWYFHTYLGYNPLGINAIDMKGVYMGKFEKPWRQTNKRAIDDAGFKTTAKHTHNALDDATEQAELFRMILDAKA
ncbi:MAG: 3'-5' exoribonuclease [Nitrososphaerota archaeon]|nr:3'-5' exoribonuclease [Ferrimicrobium acidiphilum]MDG6933692.1 3'-5' exoribonuclease [Nitrososphaerota archaeon]